jgi:sterol 3beta-glucosyltransferase
MHIVIVTWGSMGDVLPLVALAQQLRAIGCHISFGASSWFARFLEAKGIRYFQIGTHFTREEYDNLIETVVAEPNPRKQFSYLLQHTLLSDLELQYQDCLSALDDADIVISHWMQIAGIMAAEKKAKPLVTVTLNPVGIENLYGIARQTNSSSSSEQRRSNNIGLSLSDFLWGQEIHDFRARVGLKSIESISKTQYSEQLNFVAVSRSMLTEYKGWPQNHQITGFWYVDEEQDWNPDPKMLDFLNSGAKPIVISFGSMAGRNSDETTKILLEAVQRVGGRAILQAGWGKLGNLELPDNILRMDYAPHLWLFPQASCVIHHGGAGTTAAALRAGIPSVVVWHMLDQPYWGNRLAKLGLSPRPISRYDLSAQKLADRIQEAIGNSSYAQACGRMARRLAEESGAQEAARMVYELGISL